VTINLAEAPEDPRIGRVRMLTEAAADARVQALASG